MKALILFLLAAISAAAATLVWEHPGADSYTVYQISTNNVLHTTTTEKQFVFTLQPGQEAELSVTAWENGAESIPSESVFYTEPEVMLPGAPANLVLQLPPPPPQVSRFYWSWQTNTWKLATDWFAVPGVDTYIVTARAESGETSQSVVKGTVFYGTFAATSRWVIWIQATNALGVSTPRIFYSEQ